MNNSDKTLSSEQAAKLLEYLERQDSIANHDSEAYRLRSGAQFVLKTLGITREELKTLAAPAQPETEYQHPSLQERLHQIRTLADGMSVLEQQVFDAEQTAETLNLEYQARRNRLASLTDDLVGDLLNGCFPEAPVDGD